jgi:hypothetical protein
MKVRGFFYARRIHHWYLGDIRRQNLIWDAAGLEMFVDKTRYYSICLSTKVCLERSTGGFQVLLCRPMFHQVYQRAAVLSTNVLTVHLIRQRCEKIVTNS